MGLSDILDIVTKKCEGGPKRADKRRVSECDEWAFDVDEVLRPVRVEDIHRALLSSSRDQLWHLLSGQKILDTANELERELNEDFDLVHAFLKSMQKNSEIETNLNSYFGTTLAISGKRASEFTIGDSLVEKVDKSSNAAMPYDLAASESGNANKFISQFNYKIPVIKNGDKSWVVVTALPDKGVTPGSKILIDSKYSACVPLSLEFFEQAKNALDNEREYGWGTNARRIRKDVDDERIFSPEEGKIYYRKGDPFWFALVDNIFGDGMLYPFPRTGLNIKSNIYSLDENKKELVYAGPTRILNSFYPFFDLKRNDFKGKLGPIHKKKYRKNAKADEDKSAILSPVFI